MKNLKVLFIAVLGILTISQLSFAAVGQGSVVQIPFDNVNANVAADASGFGNNATLSGDVKVQRDARLGQAANFFGGSGAVTIPQSSSLEPATGTLQIWINPAISQSAGIVMKTTDLMFNSKAAGIRAVYDIHIDSKGTAYGCIADDDGAHYFTCVSSKPKAVTPGTWQLLTLRWDGSAVSLFVNGQLAGANQYTAIPGTGLSYHGFTPLTVGTFAGWGSSYGEYLGLASGLQLFNRPLADSEISAGFSAFASTK